MGSSGSAGRIVLRTLAGLVAAIFVLTLPTLLLLRAATRTVLDQDLVTRAVTEEVAESTALRQAAVREFVPRTAEETGDDILAQLTVYLSEEDWEQVSRIAIPDEWVSEQLVAALGNLYGWLEGDSPAPAFTVNTEPIKRRLLGDGSEEIVDLMVASWPPCSELQVQDMERAFLGGQGLPALACNPPEPYRSLLVGLLADAFRSEARQMPSQMAFGSAEFAADAEGFLEMKGTLRSLRLLTGWGFALPAAMLGVIMALAVRSWRGWSRWWGLPLLASGLVSFGLLLLFGVGRESLLADLLAGFEGPVELRLLIRRVLDVLYGEALRRGAVLALIVSALGGFLVVISFVLPGRSETKTIDLDRRP